MKTNRLFTGNVYYKDELYKENAILIYYPNRGFIEVDLSTSNFNYYLFALGILNNYFLNTTTKQVYYIDKKSIRPFTYDFINGVSSVNIKQLKKIAESYYNEKR